MCICKHAGVEQTRFLSAEEPLIISKQRLERYECLFCLVIQCLRVHDCQEFEQLFFSRYTKFARYCEADEGIARSREDIEWFSNGSKVVREVYVVELERLLAKYL